MREPDDIYTLDGVINNLIKIALHNVHTSIPCVVESFNGDGTVNATPVIKRVDLENNESTIPTLSSIPIVYPSAGNFRITFPISKGDEGILMFSEREIGQFIEKGSVTRPIMFRKHNLSDAVFIPAMVSKPNRNNVTASEGLVLEDTTGFGAKIEIKNGVIRMYGQVIVESLPNSGLPDITLNTHIHQFAGSGPPQPDGGGGPQ